MRAKMSTATTIGKHTNCCGKTVGEKKEEDGGKHLSSLNGRGPARSSRGSGEMRNARGKRVKYCFGRVEEIFRPSQEIFGGPDNDRLLFIGRFECQAQNELFTTIFTIY
jgi:hypothetical protein